LASNDPEVSKKLTDEDAGQASQWFAGLEPKIWQTVVEADRVSEGHSSINPQAMPWHNGGDEPIGNRIIETAAGPDRAESRDPHSGVIAYVPAGSVRQRKRTGPRPAARQDNYVALYVMVVARRIGRSASIAGYFTDVSFPASFITLRMVAAPGA